jgi:outer membrane receptor for ferrienterochelin and colicins
MNKLILFVLLASPVLTFSQKQVESDTSHWSIGLDDVVVTATFAPTHSRSAIHEIRVLDRVDIERLQARNLHQLLTTDASLRIQEDRFLGSKTSLLGIGGQNVKILIDGVPVIGRLDGNLDLGQIHLDDVEQVEIVEGPLSVNYGTDALAGVINIITKKSQLEKIKTSLDLAFDEKGEKSATANVGYRPAKNWYLGLNGGIDDFDGYDPDSTRSQLWSPKEQIYGGATVRFLPSEVHDVKYSLNYLDETITNVGDIRRPQFKPYAFDESYHTRRMDQVLHYDGTYDEAWYLSSFLSYNRFDREVKAWRQDIETSIQSPLTADQDTSVIQSWNWRATLSHQPQEGKFSFQLGTDLRSDVSKGGRIDNGGDNEASIEDYAVFGSARFRLLDRVILDGGLRYSYNSKFTTPIVPTFNIKYELNENWTFRGSYGKGFRSPDIKELFFNFVDVNHFVVGNPSLRPEHSNNFQAGFTYYRFFRGQEVTFGLKAFYNDIRDKIDLFEYLETPGGVIPALDTVTNEFTYFNLEEFRTTGLGIRFGFDEARWKCRVGYNLVGTLEPRITKKFRAAESYNFSNELSVDVRYRIPVIDTDINLLGRYYDRLISFYPAQDANGNEILGKRIQDGYSIVDLKLSRSFWQERIRLNGGVKNVLNVKRTEVNGGEGDMHGANTTILHISPGRSFFAGIVFLFAQ